MSDVKKEFFEIRISSKHNEMIKEPSSHTFVNKKYSFE